MKWLLMVKKSLISNLYGLTYVNALVVRKVNFCKSTICEEVFWDKEGLHWLPEHGCVPVYPVLLSIQGQRLHFDLVNRKNLLFIIHFAACIHLIVLCFELSFCFNVWSLWEQSCHGHSSQPPQWTLLLSSVTTCRPSLSPSLFIHLHWYAKVISKSETCLTAVNQRTNVRIVTQTQVLITHLSTLLPLSATEHSPWRMSYLKLP